MDEKLNLDEIEKVCEAATPGPWRYDKMHGGITDPRYYHVVDITFGRDIPEDKHIETDKFGHCHLPDFELIAKARTWLPALVRELREVEEKVNRRREVEVVLRVRELELGEECDVLRARVEELEAALETVKARSWYPAQSIEYCAYCHIRMKDEIHLKKCPFAALATGADVERCPV